MLERIIVDTGADLENISKVINGAVQATTLDKIPITLVCPKKYLTKIKLPVGSEIVYSERVYGMEESASRILSDRNAQTSIRIATELVAENNTPLISAGNTGATVVSAIHIIGKLNYLERPPIVCTLPTFPEERDIITLDYCLLADAGATLDWTPKLLRDYAILCSVYSETMFNKKEPLVGLIGFGEEVEKTPKKFEETYLLLNKCPLVNFVGNIEPNKIREIDILITPGYEGNLMLKSAEGGAELVGNSFKKVIKESDLVTKLKYFITRDIFKKAFELVDQRNYPGVVLGLNELVFILHGRSDEKAMRVGIKKAHQHLSKRKELIEKSQKALTL